MASERVIAAILLVGTLSLAQDGKIQFDGEGHFENLKQLTRGGENAEAYFSFGGDSLIFQSTRGDLDCDQIFIMGLTGGEPHMVSTGRGKTTCAYFLPGDQAILYSSTHHVDPKCPPRPDYSQGYVWPLDRYDIFQARPDGSHVQPLVEGPGYDAEATVSPLGDRIVFTSDRDGDLELYTCAIDGSDIRRLTHHVGYDGGGFFSPDGTKIVFRAQVLKTPEDTNRYHTRLAQRLIEPRALEIFVIDVDGSNRRQITSNGAANFCPFFHPSGQKIIFSSNLHDPKGRDFDLYLVNVDGTGLERVTFSPDFDGFPMFSPDGKKLVFASNRNQAKRGETNVFLADWKD